MMKKIIPIICIATATLMVSCGSNTNGNKKSTTQDSTQVKDTTKVANVNTNDSVQYILPSPMQIAFNFAQSKLKYHGNLTNPTDNAAKYNTKYAQKLGFGVYAADLAYGVVNDQNQAAINDIKALGSISEKLWMTNIFENSTVLSRFRKNIGNKDSLVAVISDMQKMQDNYIQQNGISKTSSVIFTGAWVETMYIASNAIKIENNTQLMEKMSNQSVVLHNILGVLNQQNDPNTKDLRTHLMKIGTLLNGMSFQENDVKIDKTKLNNLINAISATRKLIIAG